MNGRLKRILILFSICLNVGFVAVAGYAVLDDTFHLFGRSSSRVRHLKAFNNLSLDSSQEAKVDKAVARYLSRMKSLRSRSIHEKMSFLTQLQRPSPPDKAKLEQYLASLQKLELEKEETKFRHLVEIRRLLTSDQSKQFFGELEAHFERRLRHRKR